jgi:hypothetical protein
MDNPRRRKVPARASADKAHKIRKRAGELAMNRGQPAHEPSYEDVRRAERELLGLQTLPNPDDPSAKKPR